MTNEAEGLAAEEVPAQLGVLEYGDALAAAQKRVRELEAENRTLRAYINGVERGLRAKQPEIRIERSDGG